MPMPGMSGKGGVLIKRVNPKIVARGRQLWGRNFMKAKSFSFDAAETARVVNDIMHVITTRSDMVGYTVMNEGTPAQRGFIAYIYPIGKAMMMYRVSSGDPSKGLGEFTISGKLMQLGLPPITTMAEQYIEQTGQSTPTQEQSTQFNPIISSLAMDKYGII